MELNEIKQTIFESALKDVAFDGWTIAVFEDAAERNGHERQIINALFPNGVRDLLKYFSHWADQKMIEALRSVDQTDMRIRDRVRIALETRIAILNPYKECVRLGFKHLIHPQNGRTGTTMTWETADAIWTWAGDTSQDYNHYTKRILLSGIISTSFAYWLQDSSDNHEKTLNFLKNRIDNALSIGKYAGKLASPLARISNRFIVRSNPFNRENI